VRTVQLPRKVNVGGVNDSSCHVRATTQQKKSALASSRKLKNNAHHRRFFFRNLSTAIE
jgi:hypothetical protein